MRDFCLTAKERVSSLLLPSRVPVVNGKVFASVRTLNGACNGLALSVIPVFLPGFELLFWFAEPCASRSRRAAVIVC